MYFFVWGIAGIARRGLVRKVFAIVLIMFIGGLVYQNGEAGISSINAKTVQGIFTSESSYLSAITLSSQSGQQTQQQSTGASTTGSFTISTITAATPTTTVPVAGIQPAQVVDSAWVAQFVQDVNQARQNVGSSPLQENTTLDQFSKIRAGAAIGNYTISHYGYDQDASCFFVNCIPYSELGVNWG